MLCLERAAIVANRRTVPPQIQPVRSIFPLQRPAVTPVRQTQESELIALVTRSIAQGLLQHCDNPEIPYGAPLYSRRL